MGRALICKSAKRLLYSQKHQPKPEKLLMLLLLASHGKAIKSPVDSANALWVAYSAEGSAKAGQLSGLIETAKQKIREMYPDVTA